MGETPERELRAGLAEGRETAYAELYDRWAARLFRVAWELSGSRETAEDAVQDVFTGLFRGRRGLMRVERLDAYLFAALRHAVARRAGRKRAMASMDAGTPPPAAPVPVVPGKTARLEEALQRLPSDQREVVSLKVDADLTFEAIGEALGISANTAASRYRYALEKLRSAMKERPDA